MEKKFLSKLHSLIPVAGAILIAATFTTPAAQAEDKEALAKKLSNPVAALISVPFQFNYDWDIGPDDNGERYFLNIQPVIPLSISDNWNVISRTILPVISQDEIYPGAGSQSGLGDVVQSLFFSPKLPTNNGWVLGAGPVFMLPTATDVLLGADKWGLGPTAVALKQTGPWTYGAMFNHIWSVAGDNDRQDISNTFLQPFLSYTTKSATSFTVNSESTYYWEFEQWAVPINLSVAQVTKIGGQLVQFGAGVRYWAESIDSGPEGFGGRLFVTLLFPK